jgi:hypothetical protein
MATDIQLTEITDSTVFNSSDVMGNFNKLKLGITNVENGLSSLKLTDENIDVVAEDKKLSEVLPTVARKGEILPQDIKGNVDSKGMVTSISSYADDSGDISYNYINTEGTYKKGWIFLSNTYAKKTDLESLQTSSSKEIESLKAKDKLLEQKDVELQSAIDGIKQDISSVKQDIGGYATRLETANNGIEARL